MSALRDRLAHVRKVTGKHPGIVRWVVRAALALVGVWVFYVVVANAVLASHVIEKEINGGTKDVEMHLGRSWTIWPGKVHVNDFSLRVNDGNIQALLTIEHATTWIELLPLVKQKVNLHDPVATGAVFWMRNRVDAITPANKAQVDAYAPIPKAEPPIYDPVQLAKPAPPPDKLWQVRLEGGEAWGTELWIQEFRYRGAFHGTGGFYLWPLVEFTLFPTVGSLAPGLLTIGEHEVSQDVAVDTQLSMARFEVPKVMGLDPLRGLDAHAVLTATLPNSKFMAVYTPLGVPNVGFTDATLRVDADFHEKHFTENTDIAVRFKNVDVRETVLLSGPLQVHAKGRPKGHLEVGADSLGLTLQIPKLEVTGKNAWRIEKVSVRGDAFLELDEKPALSPDAIRGAFVIPSLAFLNSGTLTASGKLTASVQAARNAKGAVTGSIDTTIDETQLTAKTLAGAFAGKLKTTFAAPPRAEFPFDGTTFDNVTLDLPILTLRAGAISRSTWFKAKLPQVTWNAGTFQGKGEIEAGDSALFAVPVEDQGGVAAFAAKWLRGGAANLHGAFKVGPKSYDFDLERGRVGQVEATGFMKQVNQRPFGAFLVSTSGLSAGIQINAGGVSVTPLAGAAWLQEQRGKAR